VSAPGFSPAFNRCLMEFLQIMNERQNLPNPVRERLPASRGLSWLLQSLALIRRQPARLLFMAVLLQLILGLSQVPVLGMLVILALPAFSAGLLEAFSRVETGRLLPSSTLFVPLAEKPANGRLLLLGVLMFAVASLSVLLVMGGSEAQLDASLLQRIEQGDATAIAELDPVLTSRILFSALLAISISGTLSFLAIPLIWFHRLPMPRALLLGLQALLRHWQAFLVLGLGMTVLLLPVIVFFVMMMKLAGAISPLSLVFVVLLMLGALLFQLVVLATQYFACKDIFGPGPRQGQQNTEPEGDNPGDGQLLA
jgi:hypothetical protein